MPCGIYRITNIINGKKYIGQSVDILKRWYEHKYKAECQKDISYNSALHSAFRKYGVENFKFEIVEECDPSILDDEEKKIILFENTIIPNGYNISGGGRYDKERVKIDYSDFGFMIQKANKKCSMCGKELNRRTKGELCFVCYNKTRERNDIDFDDIKRRIYETNSMEKVAKELNVTSNSIKKWFMKAGYPYHRDEIIKLYCDENGISYPKRLLSKSQKVDRRKKVRSYRVDGTVVSEYDSIREAARKVGCQNSNICAVLSGKNKTARGLMWKYVDT